jgi:YidC/Oxa1 family membrane protein insertase
MGSCLPLLIQMPIFLVLFRVVQGLTKLGPDNTFEPRYLEQTSELYLSLKGQTQMLFLGIDLEKTPLNSLRDDGFIKALPYLVLIGLWVSTSYLQQRQVSGRSPEAMNPQQRMMMRIIPIFSLTAVAFPAALSIYWVTSNLCRVATQGYISQRYYQMGWLGFGKKKDGENGKATPATVEVKAKPKPAAKDQTKGGDTKPARPTTGRVTPAKGKSTPNRRPGSAPGRRTNNSGSSGERPRRRVVNGPTADGGNGPGDGDKGSDKRRG